MNPANYNPAVHAGKIRVAIFASFYRGFYVLSEFLHGEISGQVTVVGVATDDPTQGFVSPHKRVWQYPHTLAEQEMVEKLARKANVEVYKGRVKTADFYAIYETKWKPDLCVMATFGQKIDPRLFDAPPLGFYNLHPCTDDAWPSRYVGANPFQLLLNDNIEYARIAMHRVNEDFDSGELVAYSEKIYIPEHVSVIDLHKLTSPSAGRLAAREIGQIMERAR